MTSPLGHHRNAFRNDGESNGKLRSKWCGSFDIFVAVSDDSVDDSDIGIPRFIMNSLASPHCTSKLPGDTSMPFFLALSLQYSTASVPSIVECEYCKSCHCEDNVGKGKWQTEIFYSPGLRSFATIRQPF